MQKVIEHLFCTSSNTIETSTLTKCLLFVLLFSACAQFFKCMNCKKKKRLNILHVQLVSVRVFIVAQAY